MTIRFLTLFVPLLVLLSCADATAPDEAPAAAPETGETPEKSSSPSSTTSNTNLQDQQRKKAVSLAQQGQQLAQALQYAMALEKFKAAVKLDPQNAVARVGLETKPVPLADAELAKRAVGQAIHLARLRNFLPAYDLFKKAMKLDPNNEKALRNAANCALEIRRFHEALSIFDRAIERYPMNLESRINAAVASYRSRHYERSLDYMRGLEPMLSRADLPREMKAMVPQIWFMRGLAANYCHLVPEAIDGLQRATRLRPDNSEYHHILGGVYLDDGQFQLALRSLVRAQELAEQQPQKNLGYIRSKNLYFIARCHDKLGNKQEAIKWYRDSIKWDKTNFLTFVQAARCFEALGGKKNFQQAVAYLDQALRLNQLSHEAYFSMSGIWRKLGDKAQAEQYHERYTQVNGVAKEQEEKLRAIAKRVRANPDDPKARLEALQIHTRFGHWKDAMDEVRDLLILHPTNIDGLWHSANLLLVEKRHEDAYYEALKLIENGPTDSRGYTLAATACREIANTHKKSNNTPALEARQAEAIEFCSKALSLNENDYGALETIIGLYGQVGGHEQDIAKLMPRYERLKAQEAELRKKREQEDAGLLRITAPGRQEDGRK